MWGWNLEVGFLMSGRQRDQSEGLKCVDFDFKCKFTKTCQTV